MFMVHDEIWFQAGYQKEDIACLPCFEKRLGRKVTHDDLRLCPLNFMEIPGFNTEENYRKMYAQDGQDYDKTKAEYFARCEKLGVEPKWVTFESSQTPQSDQSECFCSPNLSHPVSLEQFVGQRRARRRLSRLAGQGEPQD